MSTSTRSGTSTSMEETPTTGVVLVSMPAAPDRTKKRRTKTGRDHSSRQRFQNNLSFALTATTLVLLGVLSAFYGNAPDYYSTSRNNSARSTFTSTSITRHLEDANDDDSSNSNSNNNSNDSNNSTYSCSWTGKLSEFQGHSNSDCPLRRVSCPIIGCNWEGPHCAMGKHNADDILIHTDLIIASKMNKIKEQLMRASNANANANANANDGQNITNNTIVARLDELEHRLFQKDREIQTLKERLLDNWLSDNFVRDWIVAKPPYFRDFCVYRPIQHLTGPISQIIVGIPGPRNTDWQDGLYPLLVTFTPEGFERKEPPKCDFPEDFFHPNVYEGNVHVNTLVEFEGPWDPSISLPELFFCIQQLLAHPNHRGSLSTSSTSGGLYDPMEYRRAVRQQATKYEYRRTNTIDINGNNNNNGNAYVLGNTDSYDNSGSSEFLERAMVELTAKIDPEYKKPLQTWENERWESLEEVRWKGWRSFQRRGDQQQQQQQQQHPPIPLQRQRRSRHDNINNDEDNTDEMVQIIMTTNSNDGSERVGTSIGSDVNANVNNDRATNTSYLRNDNGDVCECSCCVQGGASRPFIDREHRMRYIFGEGG